MATCSWFVLYYYSRLGWIGLNSTGNGCGQSTVWWLAILVCPRQWQLLSTYNLQVSYDKLNSPTPPPPQFPEHPYGDLMEKLILYRHEANNQLVPFKANDPVEDGIIVDVVLNGM